MTSRSDRPAHVPTEPYQLQYGKVGLWKAACSCGKYETRHHYGTAASALRAAQQHADTKNAATSSGAG